MKKKLNVAIFLGLSCLIFEASAHAVTSARDLERMLKEANENNREEIEALRTQQTVTGAVVEYVAAGEVADERLGPCWKFPAPENTILCDPISKGRGDALVDHVDLGSKCAKVGGEPYTREELMGVLKHLGKGVNYTVSDFVSYLKKGEFWTSTLESESDDARAFFVDGKDASYGWDVREGWEKRVLCGPKH